MFKPLRLFSRFLVSPYLWVTLAVLNLVMAGATYFYRHPPRDWMLKQSRLELYAAMFFLFVAAVHFLVRFCLRRPDTWRKWWRRLRFPVLGAVAAVILALVVFALIRCRSNEALAREIRAEFNAWLETLPKVPDAENGMLILVEGLEAFDELPPEPMVSGDFSVANEEHRKALLEYLAPREQALEKVYEGLRYEKFMYTADYSEGFATELPPFLGFKYAAKALAWKGELAELEGKTPDALKEYLSAIRLGRTLANERCLISALIEIAVEYIGLLPLTKALSESSIAEKELGETVETLLELHGKGGTFYTSVEGEYYCGWAYVAADIIEGKFDYDRPAHGVDDLLGSIWFSKYIYNYRADMEKFRKALEIYRRVDPAKYWRLPPEAKDEDTFVAKIGISPGELTLAALCMPHLASGGEALVEIEVLWRGAIALAAIRLFETRQGRLPGSLAELGELVPNELLVDPFSGNDLVYRVEGGDFYLYSVGYNGVDDKCSTDIPHFEGGKRPLLALDAAFHVPAGAREKQK